jgi:hypothetical protein
MQDLEALQSIAAFGLSPHDVLSNSMTSGKKKCKPMIGANAYEDGIDKLST